MDDAMGQDRRLAAWPEGSALAALIRSRDWSATPLGSIETWSAGLRTAAAIMLNVRRPTSIVWGPSCNLLYNDALRPLIGPSHPMALGTPLRETFPSMWESIGPALIDAVKTGRSGMKRIVLRPCRPGTDPRTGRERRLALRLTPIRNGEESVEGFLIPMYVVAKSGAPGRVLLERVPQLIWLADGSGLWTWASPQWTATTGLSDKESRGLGWLNAIHPDDRRATMSAWKQVATRGILEVEHRIWHAKETVHRWYQSRAVAVRDTPGQAAEWVGTCTDVHGIRRLQDQQGLLIAELQHRTRNLLGIVRGVALQIEATSQSLEDFGARFDECLAALDRVQGLLSQQGSITLGELVRLELSAHGVVGDRAERCRVSGPTVTLPGRTVQMLALTLHELTTNAAKHGALATPQGSLDVAWRIVGPPSSGEPERLTLTWSEYGVAIQHGTVSTRRGFGRELIEVAFPYELGATTCLEFAADGVRCRIELPLRRHRRGIPGNDRA